MQKLNQGHLNQLGQTVGAHQARVEGAELIKMQEAFAGFKNSSTCQLVTNPGRLHCHLLNDLMTRENN
jgi:hypothetical protein